MGMTIDTLGLAQRLESGGFTREQAETLASALGGQPAQLVTVPLLDQRLAALNLDQRFRELEQRLTIKMGWMALTIVGAVSAVTTILHFVR
jgi:hypothetical protein